MARAEATPDARPDPLRRLGGGRWETKDGRFGIEPQSGTWVVVDTTQTDGFGLPLVRGPFPSLTAARHAIEAARSEGPIESPLAERIEKARSVAKPAAAEPLGPSTSPKAVDRTTARPKPAAGEPEPPPDPAWLRALQAGERRRAKALIARLERLGVADAEGIARAEVVDDRPSLARLAIERGLRAALGSTTDARAAVAAAVEVVLRGSDAVLEVEWRLTDGRGRPVDAIDVSAGGSGDADG